MHHSIKTTLLFSLVIGLLASIGYAIDDDAANAFATGRNPEHTSVAATLASAIYRLAQIAFFSGGLGDRSHVHYWSWY